MVRTVAVIAALTTAAAVVPATANAASIPAAPAAASPGQPVPPSSHVSKAGYPAQWIQYPYLSGGKKGKLTVVAKVYADPRRTRARNGYKQDELTLRVAVGKKRFSKVNKPRSVEVLPDSALLTRTHKTRKVTKPGVLTFKIPLSKKVSGKLRNRGFQGQRAAVAVSMSHRKDAKKGGADYEVSQVSVGQLVKSKSSKDKIRRTTAGAVKQLRILRRATDRTSKTAAATLASTPDTPYFNLIYVQNNSPFAQQITFQPVIQCMFAANYQTPGNPAPPPASQQTVPAGGQAVFYYAQGPEFELNVDYPQGLYGAEKGLNAPGTQATLTTDLVNSGNAAGQNATDAVFSGSSYSTAGAIGAIAAASVRFLVSFITGLKVDTCTETSQYPQLFAVNSVVTGFGTNSVSDPTQATWPATNTWAGNPAAGNQGSYNDVPGASFVNGTLRQAMGAQTNVVYYWNGGAPAPMVSPDASSGTYTGGSATFQDGLIQYVGPNPGNPAGESTCQLLGGPNGAQYYCNYQQLGEMYIQLSYLTNPEYSSGMLNDGNPPTMTATVDSTGDYTLRCDLSEMTATLTTPFGQSAPTTVEQSTLTNTATNGSGQLPQNADWLVNFFGVNADGQPVYIQESVANATNGVNTPYLAPNAANQPVSIQAASAGGSQAVALGTVTSANLSNMVTLDGTPSVPTQFGCTASPTISLPGLKVNAANGTAIATAYGNNWPVPTQSDQGWPAGYYGKNTGPFNYGWQKTVNQVNVTFQGPSLSDITAAPQG